MQLAAWHMRAPGRVGTSLCSFRCIWSLTGDPNLSLRDLDAARLACQSTGIKMWKPDFLSKIKIGPQKNRLEMGLREIESNTFL